MLNKIKTALLSQGERSTVLDRCAYRGDDGTKCAVGLFISDEEYDLEMDEGSQGIQGFNANALEYFFPNLELWKKMPLEIWGKVQRVHDLANDKEFMEQVTKGMDELIEEYPEYA